jgi:aromatic-L-amino-acid decarboxylase
MAAHALGLVVRDVIYDTNRSRRCALAAAREMAVPRAAGTRGRADLKGALSTAPARALSVDKSVILPTRPRLARRLPADADFRLQPAHLLDAIRADRAAGFIPLATIATVGSTSSTSVDPVDAIARICEDEGVWLHVDAAYAGVAAMVPGYEWILKGADRADSLVVNPHKWLFTPFDLSALYCRRMDAVRQAFALTPEYLKTSEGQAGVRNLMDTGIQLGRRFRALKLWMILRHFGAEGLRAHLAEHMRLARVFASWVEASDRFELAAPVPFSVVCFRLKGEWTDDDNARILDAVNASGDVFLSHTRLDGRYVLRLAIGNLQTAELHSAAPGTC